LKVIKSIFYLAKKCWGY